MTALSQSTRRPYFENVIGGFMHGIKLGLVEAINGKIARLRATAHGYSDREYFKLKDLPALQPAAQSVGEDCPVIRVRTGNREEPPSARQVQRACRNGPGRRSP